MVPVSIEFDHDKRPILRGNAKKLDEQKHKNQVKTWSNVKSSLLFGIDFIISFMRSWIKSVSASCNISEPSSSHRVAAYASQNNCCHSPLLTSDFKGRLVMI